MNNFETFSSIYEEMKIHGMQVPKETVNLQINNSRKILDNAMSYFLSFEGRSYEKQPEYEQVAEWLSNNKGKGLFLYGNCGRGKTILARFVIPAILLKYCRKVVSFYNATDLDLKVDEALKKHIISIDDIGVETESVNYGKRRIPVAEIVDAAEKNGKLLIITSNLTGEDIIHRYGDRVYDRIISTCKRVLFTGESLRK